MRIVVLSIIICLLSPKWAYAQSNRGAKVVQLKNKELNNIKGLFVGISDYKFLPSNQQLQFAQSDATNFYQLIQSIPRNPEEELQYVALYDSLATAANIYKGLDWLLETTQPGDFVIIYFSGHGDVEQKTIRQRGFLLAHDSPAAGYHSGGTVRVSDLQDYVETLTLNDKRVLLIIDACRSGKLAGGESGASFTANNLKNEWNNTIKLLSSQPGELSQEGRQWGGGFGAFTYHLINGFKGQADKNKDGILLLGEMDVHLKTTVPLETDFSQNPIIMGDARTPLFLLNDPLLLKDNSTSTIAMKGKVSVLSKKEKGPGYYLDMFDKSMQRNDYTKSKRTSAYSLLKEFKSKFPEEQNVINFMARELKSSLTNFSQDLISEYMAGLKTSHNYNIYAKAASYMKIVLELFPAGSIGYDNIRTRYLFLDAYKEYVANNSLRRTLAINNLNEAIKIKPDAAFLYHALGQVLIWDNEDHKEGLDYLKKANDLAPKWNYPYLSIGAELLRINQVDSAIMHFNQAIELQPKLALSYNQRGSASAFIGNFTDAKLDFAKAISLDSNYVDPFYNLGALYFTEGNITEALNYLDKALELDNSHYGSKKLMDKILIASLDTAVKNKEFINAAYIQLRRYSINEGDYSLLESAATYFIMAKDYEHGASVLLNLIDKKQLSASGYFELARAYSGSGQIDKGYFFLKQAFILGCKKFALKEEEFNNFRDRKEVRELIMMYEN